MEIEQNNVKFLKEELKKKGLLQTAIKEIAEYYKMSNRSVERWFLGECKIPFPKEAWSINLMQTILQNHALRLDK